MALRVKQGRKYYFEGREYGPGEVVDAKIPESYIPQLTNAWGPLEKGGPAKNKTDIPRRVLTAAAKAPEPAPLSDPAPSAAGRYSRRDLTAQE